MRASWEQPSRRASASLLTLSPNRHAYLVPAAGVVEVEGLRIEARDGAAITDQASVEIVGIEEAEVILVDAA
jgi:quercetin 2,3-dioxygenase